MNLTAWLNEREQRRKAYDAACIDGAKLLFHYDRTGAGLRELCANTLLLDRLYLAWCETDRWETEVRDDDENSTCNLLARTR